MHFGALLAKCLGRQDTDEKCADPRCVSHVVAKHFHCLVRSFCAYDIFRALPVEADRSLVSHKTAE